jgi:hypothetical protein
MVEERQPIGTVENSPPSFRPFCVDILESHQADHSMNLYKKIWGVLIYRENLGLLIWWLYNYVTELPRRLSNM